MEKKVKKQFNFEELSFSPNRELIHENPSIAEKGDKFCFKDGFYFNEDQSIVLRSSFVFGKIFKPI